MTTSQHPRRAREIPGLTACSLCAGETLAAGDPLPGGQRARLDRLDADGVARVTYVECLDECERGDVVVARPVPAQRRRGAGPTWFEQLAGEEATARLASWLEAGGPGACALPDELRPLVIDRTGEPPEPAADATTAVADGAQHAHAGHHREGGGAAADGAPAPGDGAAIDPVCGMSVDPASAAASAEHDGATFFFCAKGCQKAFLKDPGSFL